MGKHHSGYDYVKAAQKAGLRVEMGRGDHCKVYGPTGQGFETIPLHRELSNGTEHAIAKWFKAIGIVLGCFIGFCLINPTFGYQVWCIVFGAY